MRGRFLPSIAAVLVVLVMLVVTSEPASGQGGRSGGTPPPAGPIPRTPDGKPDLTGSWNERMNFAHTIVLEAHAGGFGVTAGKGLIIDPPDGIIQYQPWALAERNRRREDANGYEDPVGHCEFHDIAHLHSFGQQILYSGNNIIINAMHTITRVIAMNRREHLPEGIRLWQGDPIGWWEGDTLVVDSTNFNGKTRMVIGGDFYGANAHVVERFTMVDANTINWTMTITDPDVFTRPWTMTSSVPMTRGRRPAGAIDFDGEDTCHEGNIHLVHLKNVYDQARAKVRPHSWKRRRTAVLTAWVNRFSTLVSSRTGCWAPGGRGTRFSQQRLTA